MLRVYVLRESSSVLLPILVCSFDVSSTMADIDSTSNDIALKHWMLIEPVVISRFNINSNIVSEADMTFVYMTYS